MAKICSVSIVAAFVLAGCTTVTEIPPLAYPEQVLRAKTEDVVDVAALADSFIEEQMSAELLQELAQFELETRAFSDRKLPLGPLGTAILDRCYISLVGHTAMAEFYEYLGEKQATMHRDWITSIKRYIAEDREGTREDPYRAFTKPQSEAFVESGGGRLIGSYYDSVPETPLLLAVLVAKDSTKSDTVYFDFSATFDELASLVNVPEESDEADRRNYVMYFLASQGDSAAQASMGSLLAQLGRTQEARRWLNAAIRGGNAYAHLISARMYVARASRGRESSRSTFLTWAHGHYNSAVEAGLDPALRELGRLLIQGDFGDKAVEEGIAYLERAAQQHDVPALISLARMAYGGQFQGKPDFERAATFYEKAARIGDPPVRVEYFRFLTDANTGLGATRQSLDWLEEAADSGSAEAMIEIGNCHARGCLEKPNYRKAKSWYRRAVRAASENPNVVNEVAWTMTVSHIDSLRSPRYARRIMDQMMENSESARQQPEFLDTWAAAYAATGDFEKAVELQNQALRVAQSNRTLPQEHLEAIKEHLESFSKGEAVLKPIP